MFNLILSAVLGVLATKILDSTNLRKKRQPLWIIVFTVISCLLVCLYNLMVKSQQPSNIYTWLSGLLNDFEGNYFLQGILIAIAIVVILYIDRREIGVLPFNKYSEKIREFTKRARPNSVIKIAAGDMDFFGGIKVDGVDISNLIDDCIEYQQLIDLGRNPNLRLEILCSHGLEKDSELLDAIIKGTTNPKALYIKYKSKSGLDNSTFQQLLRIGRIKTDFKGSVDFRFYNARIEDKEFRARFVDSAGIVYRKERERTKLDIKSIKRIPSFPFFKVGAIAEDLYSVNNLSKQEYSYYADMFMLKWNACDINKCKKVITFCESLYRFVNESEPRFHMALVYVNSYEIARKEERRKEFPPFGVMYLAASVRKNPDWKVELIAVDERTPNEVLQTWDKYDVIGFSIISSYSYDILKRCYNASKKKPGVVTIAGGYQAVKFNNNVFEDFNADIIFRGEGEDSIRSFCEHYEDSNYSAIKGIIYRDANQDIQTTEGPLWVDVDKIPFPARDLIPVEDIVMTDRLAGTELKMVHMLFSRGCKYNCLYCAANQDHRIKEIRYRDKHLIIKELQELKERYLIDGFSIIDDCFLTDQEKAIEICEYITSQHIGLQWSLAARVDNINEEVLKALRNAGCIEIKFGVETGSDTLLQRMRKGVTVADAEKAIRQTKKYGMKVKLFIITGLPFETDDTHNETKKFLERMHSENLVDRISLLRYTPLAGSYIYDHPEPYGVKKNMLNSRNFSKVSLYRKSHNWWTDKSRYASCERWYKDMRKFIDDRWTDT